MPAPLTNDPFSLSENAINAYIQDHHWHTDTPQRFDPNETVLMGRWLIQRSKTAAEPALSSAMEELFMMVAFHSNLSVPAWSRLILLCTAEQTTTLRIVASGIIEEYTAFTNGEPHSKSAELIAFRNNQLVMLLNDLL